MAAKKPVRGQRAKTNAAAKGSGSTVHRVKHGSGPRVIGKTEKPPKNLQRLRQTQSRNK